MSQFTNSILIDLDFSVDKLLNTGNCCFLSSTYKKSSNIITYLTLSKFYIFDSQHISFMVGSDSMFLCCSYWTWDMKPVDSGHVTTVAVAVHQHRSWEVSPTESDHFRLIIFNFAIETIISDLRDMILLKTILLFEWLFLIRES